jgi:hypothetical protein
MRYCSEEAAAGGKRASGAKGFLARVLQLVMDAREAGERVWRWDG